MNLDWILHPLTLCLEVAAGLIACLYLVLVTGNELYSLKRKSRRYQQWTESSIQQLDGRLKRLETIEFRPADDLDERRGETGSDQRRRIIQLAQEGRSAEHIAAVMQLPKPEVEFVLSCYHSVLQLNAATSPRARRMLPLSDDDQER